MASLVEHAAQGDSLITPEELQAQRRQGVSRAIRVDCSSWIHFLRPSGDPELTIDDEVWARARH